MLPIFSELEELFSSRNILLKNIYMSKTFHNIDLVCLTKDNYVKEINQRKNNLNIITVDFFVSTNETYKKEYLIFVVDNTILIINISDLSIINYFFTYYANYTFYCVSDDAVQFLDKKFPDYTNNYSRKNQNNCFYDEIERFTSYIIHKDYKTDKKFKIIKKCISGYLLQKSYQKSNIYRINHLNNKQHTNSANRTKTYDKYITLKKFCGTSVVRLAYNIEEEKLFIVKIHPNDDSEFLNLINRELNNYKNINHPLLPNIYEHFVECNQHYIVIEYINGETFDNVDLKEFKEIELMNMLFELMISIHYIHSLGYICRDIKPNNIIVDNFKTAILIDFDRVLSKNEQTERKEFTRDFNHKYIAPEIINGNHFTNKADIYSLGQIIYDVFISKPLKNISNNVYSKLNIMCKYCIKDDQDERPTISQLIRYFYLNILSKIDEKQGIEKKLIQILENNFDIQDLFDPDGLCTLGMIFYQGIYIEKDMNEAIKYFTKASHQDDLISLINLHDLDINPIENIQKAIKQYPNEPILFYLLGIHYIFGNGLINEGIECLKYALEFDFNGIPYHLGLLYFQSLNEMNNFICAIQYIDTKNKSKSLKYFLMASKYKTSYVKKNNDFYDFHGILILPNIEIAIYYKLFTGHFIATLSKYYIGIIFSNQNVFTAIKYLTEVAEQEILTLQDFLKKNNLNQKYIQESHLIIIDTFLKNYNDAIICSNTLLGVIYMEGLFTKRNIVKALNYLSKPANQNDLLTHLILAYYYIEKNDVSKAIEHFSLVGNNFKYIEKIADAAFSSKKLPQNTQNFLNPQMKLINQVMCRLTTKLGDIYYFGNWVQKNIFKAIKFYQIASDYNDSYGQHRLGTIYLGGLCVEKDISKAICFLESSAELNNKDSQLLLGQLYYEGKNIQKNFDKAIYYFKLADKSACKIARLYLGIIYCLKKDYENAIKYFRESSNLGYSYGKNNFAILYKDVKNTEYKINYAIEILREAIRFSGDIVARYNLAHIYFYNYDNRNIDESIQILTKPSLISLKDGLQLLCLAVIEKCEILTANNIADKIPEIENVIQNKIITSKIYNEILSNEWNDFNKYTILYDDIGKKEYLYVDDGNSIISLAELHSYKDIQKQTTTIEMKKEINDQFYEGFGISI